MVTRLQERHRWIYLAYFFIDSIVVYISIFLACLSRQDTLSFPVSFVHLFTEESNPFRAVFVFWLFTILLFNNAHGLYKTRRELLEGIEVWLVTRAVCLSSLVVLVTLYVLKIEGLPRLIFVIATGSMIFFLSLWRIFKRIFVEYLVKSGYNNFNTLIIGAGRVGQALLHEIEKRPGLGIKVVGFLDDFKAGIIPDTKVKVAGKIADFEAIARREFISKIFITIHHDSDVFLKLLEQARDMDISVRVVPQGFGLTSCDFSKYNIGIIPVLEYSDADNLRKQVGKRLFDILFSVLAGILLLPVFIVIAIAIKMDSEGPIFYRSRRYGRKGQVFNMFKFRSMRRDAEETIAQIRHKNEVDGPIFKMKKDPRVTKVGCFLRKYSLDELPQIINVILGDMSLVGPRPLPIDQIEKEDLRQLKRLEVRPGITGLWQIRGRSDISFARLVKWDIWYINNWSFWLDFAILIQTIPVVCKGKGAY